VTDSRVVAVQAMYAVLIEGRSFSTVLIDAEARVDKEARPRLKAVCFEWARWATQLEAIVDSKLDKRLRNKDQDVYLLLQMGVLEMVHLGTPAHTAVNETVKTLKGLKKPWAKGLVNAVLRNTQRQPLNPDAFNRSERYAYPTWWVLAIKKDWPEQIDAILEAGNRRAPMTLRVNALRSTQAEGLSLLEEAGIGASEHGCAPAAITLDKPIPVHELPGFKDGNFSVQDGAAQMIVSLLTEAGVKPNRLLDACSAPGGKTAHLLESFDAASAVALDSSAERLTRVTETLTRLSLQDRVETKAVDAAATDQWWDGKTFDLVLLDAPCTGSGVIRRHPDIKHTRWEEDVESLAEQQARLLNALWETVSVGGYLLYATCSILKHENDKQIQRFIDSQAGAEDATPKGLTWAKPQSVGYQVLPGENNMDGFYYALLRRTS